MRRSLPKLASAAVPALRQPFKNELLHTNVTWPQEVNYLRDTYDEIRAIWEKYQDPTQDQQLYSETKPKLNELVRGLEDVVYKIPRAPHLVQAWGAGRDNAAMADLHGKGANWPMAVIYQTYALTKIHSLLETLTHLATKRGQERTSALLKRGYGYDVSGEITQEQSQNINDTAQPQDQHQTNHNPANLTMDYEAENQFPNLKDRRVPKFYHGDRK